MKQITQIFVRPVIDVGGYSSQRLFSIQVLRCVSCIMVFLVHWGQNVQLNGVLRKITNLGAYGPYLFFLISGFLAARMLSGRSVNAATITLSSVSLEDSYSPSLLVRKIISYVDSHSYALYLMHCVFIYSFIRRIMKNIPVWETGVIIILGSIVATWLGHNLIEVPIRRVFKENVTSNR